MMSAHVIDPAGPEAARLDRRDHSSAQTQRPQLQRVPASVRRLIRRPAIDTTVEIVLHAPPLSSNIRPATGNLGNVPDGVNRTLPTREPPGGGSLENT